MSQFNLSQSQIEEDFNYLWQTINDNYVYFDKKQTDWDKVKEFYSPQIKNINSKERLLKFFENVTSELYDNHAALNRNNNYSPRLVPTGLNIFAEWNGSKAVITDIKIELISKVDFSPGTEIISINDVPITEAVNKVLPACLKQVDNDVNNWALNRVLAGTYNEKRILKVLNNSGEQTIDLDSLDNLIEHTDKNLSAKILNNNIGCITINNSLGNENLIGEFGTVMTDMQSTKGLIIDLRNTPSGGISYIARAIMGRFIIKEMPYQKHILYESPYKIKRSFVEYVSPAEGLIYNKPLVILVNHWTGSMGEGIAIGFDAMNRAVIVGTKMAGLLGAIETAELPNSQIGVNISTERLYHVNGTPREDFLPGVFINMLNENFTKDVILEKGIEVIEKRTFKGKKR
jgi:carboxyl-terminal processing protease